MSLEPFELLILALAAYRVTRLITEDSIFDTPRNRLLAWLETHRLGKVAEALSCHWCTGVWASLAVYAVWLTATDTGGDWPLAAHGIYVASVAGAQGLLGSWEGGQ